MIKAPEGTNSGEDPDYEEEIDDDENPAKENDYGSAEYWQERYIKTKGQRFDWLQSYQPVKSIINRELGSNINIKILNIGCGNGEVQDHLYEAGYHQIYNNDISKEVIKQMNIVKEQKGHKEMVYQVMDVTQMTYPDKFFDLVLDKSTIDALLCSQNPYLNTAKMLEQVQRVLKDDGLYLIISYAGSENRLQHLTRKHISLSVRIEQLTKTNAEGDKLVHYAYICRKGEKIQRSEEWRKQFYEELRKLEDQDYSN